MLEIALGILRSNGFRGPRHGVQQVVHGAGFGPFEKLFELGPGLLNGIEFRGIGGQKHIADVMALQEGLDPPRAMHRMVIQDQSLAGQQEREQKGIQIGDEHAGRQRTPIAPLASQTLLRQDRHGVHRLARRHWLRVNDPLIVGRPPIRQGQVQARSGFVEIEALVEREVIDLLVIAFRVGAVFFGVFLGVIGGLFFRVRPNRWSVSCIAPRLTWTPYAAA